MKVYWALLYKGIAFDLVYVHPRNQREIAFTGQHVVPVLSIGSEWRLDSAQICIWLDELFPGKPIAGENKSSRTVIFKADQWVADNVIALDFRSVIDREESRNTFYNGRILGRTMRKTSGGVPLGLEYFWPYLLRKISFIQNDAAKIDPEKSISFHRVDILRQLEVRLGKTGFVGETNTPSFADLSAYASVISALTFGFRGGLEVLSSPTVFRWAQRIQNQMPNPLLPELVPGWKPYRLMTA